MLTRDLFAVANLFVPYGRETQTLNKRTWAKDMESYVECLGIPYAMSAQNPLSQVKHFIPNNNNNKCKKL